MRVGRVFSVVGICKRRGHLLPGAERGFQTHLTPPLPCPPHRTEAKEKKKRRNDLITEPSPQPRGILSLKIKNKMEMRSKVSEFECLVWSSAQSRPRNYCRLSSDAMASKPLPWPEVMLGHRVLLRCGSWNRLLNTLEAVPKFPRQ